MSLEDFNRAKLPVSVSNKLAQRTMVKHELSSNLIQSFKSSPILFSNKLDCVFVEVRKYRKTYKWLWMFI